MPEVKSLRNFFYNKNKSHDNFEMNQKEHFFCFKTLEQIENEASEALKSRSDKFYNDTIAFVLFVKNDMLYYDSCPNDKCTKKVVDGNFKCEKCGNNFEKSKARFILNARITDNSQTSWTVFNDVTATLMLGYSAEEIRQMKSSGKEENIAEILRNATYKELRMKILTRLDNFGTGEFKMKHFVVKIYANEIGRENRDLFDELTKCLEMKESMINN